MGSMRMVFMRRPKTCLMLLLLSLMVTMLSARYAEYKRGKPNLNWNDAIIRVNYADEHLPVFGAVHKRSSASFVKYISGADNSDDHAKQHRAYVLLKMLR